MINAGWFKQRITFYSDVNTVDSEGFKISTLTEGISTKCAVTQNAELDKNRSSSKMLDSTSSLTYCMLRYHKSINKDCIVKLNGETYRIQSYNNVNFENRFIKLVLQNE